ncbi:MAG: PD-(D/E)XK nuclease family protein, partial [Bacteroidota bacterium]
MESFLHKLAFHIGKKYPDGLSNYCFLFPNRRAGVFFKKYYASLIKTPGWFPEILTIDDFMKQISGIEPADPLELSFETYRSYRQMTSSPESYDEFYPWGEMMINDFNDIDKYLVDAEQIFTNINDLKEIDQVFDYLDQDQKLLITRFWKNFNPEKLTGQKESFLFIWKILFSVYQNLNANLRKKGLGYEGMIYRMVVEAKISHKDFILPWKKIFICGFNALSKAEDKLFSWLRDKGLAEFYWDFDSSFMQDAVHEAGRFLRINLKKFPPDEKFSPYNSDADRNREVKIYNLPSDVLQTKQIHEILYQLEASHDDAGDQKSDPFDFNKTAIILGDESLLPAVLTSLPDSMRNLNVTMGFPLSQTPVFSFLDAVLRMQLNFTRRKMKHKLYFRDLLTILNHQYIRTFYQEKTDVLIAKIHRENKIYVETEELETDELFAKLFRKINTVDGITPYLLQLLQSVFDAFPVEDPTFKMEKEYIFHIRTRLNKLKNLLEEQVSDLSLQSFIHLFRQILKDFRIPFEGEPLQGTQVMGILESRLLDFQHLIFLSMNEGVMPASGMDFSYIPTNLKYAFGMPVREDKDAIYAYYFYRLLPRAKNIHILYNSQTEGVKSGEPTRYIYQMQYLTDWNIKHYTRAFHVIERESAEIKIKKSENVRVILKKYAEPEKRDYLSPSALTSYLDCSLRFYFTYVAGLREEDEATEEIDASGFGGLYHKTMEFIYRNKKNQEITRQNIQELMEPDTIKTHIDQAFREEFLKSDDANTRVKPEGKNIIIYEIIRKLVDQTLRIDKQATPFVLVDTEQKKVHKHLNVENIRKVHLGGTIDRLDSRNGFLHLVDYKTGKVNREFPSLKTIFDRDSWKESDYFKGVFQVFMYCWLYLKEHPEVKFITPSIYLTKELFSENFSPYLTDKASSGFINNFLDYADEFESLLKDLLESIFDPTI